MSDTPIFDETVAASPKGLWQVSNVFPWPDHKWQCEFDGYNWQVCTCGHWDTETGEVIQ